MSQSQSQSQGFELGQRNATSEDLEDQRKEMISHMLTRNNRENGDDGVRAVIETLDARDPERALKTNNKLLKDQLLATLGFMNYLSFEGAKERFKGVNKPELIAKIAEKYRLISPDICKGCNKIYFPEESTEGADCFICTKRMCHRCCPKE